MPFDMVLSSSFYLNTRRIDMVFSLIIYSKALILLKFSVEYALDDEYMKGVHKDISLIALQNGKINQDQVYMKIITLFMVLLQTIKATKERQTV